MIITRTPFRISFFGGGTDYPTWYRENGGAVLSTSIDKYCYISCRYLPPFFDFKSRIVWSYIESVKHNSEIKHPAIRGILKYLDIEDGLEVQYNADLPGRCGLGTSSSFTVGFLHALYSLRRRMISKVGLAREAIHVEQNVLQEHVGTQDQVVAAFGGFNKIEFAQHRDFHVIPIILNSERLKHLKEHLMLLFTGFSRTASEIAAEQIKTIPQKQSELHAMCAMVDEAIQILASQADITEFGELLHESWLLKRSLSPKVTTPRVDALYESARRAGAIGGKLLGAGGGGFILLFVRPEHREAVKNALGPILEVPFQFETIGSHIVFYNPVDNINR